MICGHIAANLGIETGDTGWIRTVEAWRLIDFLL